MLYLGTCTIQKQCQYNVYKGSPFQIFSHGMFTEVMHWLVLAKMLLQHAMTPRVLCSSPINILLMLSLKYS